MTDFNLTPHRRYNPLNDSWVQVSPHRTQRPWQGQEDEIIPAQPISYDPSCYLCPGNQRAGNKSNPGYEGIYVFPNDFPALLPAADGSDNASTSVESELFRAQTTSGECRVICYSPDHSLALSSLPESTLLDVIDTWAEQYCDLITAHQWVQIFENRGAMMGCSNPHPHGQIWAVDHLPMEGEKELASQRDYHQRHGNSLLLDYIEKEAELDARVVCSNDQWVVVVPYWAVWPYETMLVAKQPTAHLGELDTAQRTALAAIMQQLLRTYDAIFAAPFPYSFGWHNAPKEVGAQGWQLHAHFYPPLLRSATVRKFMVGYEMLAEPQRDVTPEYASEILQNLAAKYTRT
ncbi:MAG: galactose-1-phosphate uridylyltransferase [Pseudohongiella sp.]|nr:MAG: galactose-1-phosphate uridylyltransferase [Pseudohongiella sp.]